MMSRLSQSALTLAVLLSGSPRLSAAGEKPLLHPLFTDHAVLQRGRAVPVWGWAATNATVTVRFANQTKQANVGADGRWSCSLDPLEASFESRTLTVEAAPAGTRAEARDLLVGDVWLCSGQSNMEMGITLCLEDEEIAKADHPNLRLLTVPHHIAYAPQDTFAGCWKRCTPQSVREDGWGGFSATAYFFGKQLQQELGIPIGLIHSSWGGTVAEAWTSGPALKPFAKFQPQLKSVRTIGTSTAAAPVRDAMNAWFLQHDPGTAKKWEKEETDASGWRQVTLPGTWTDCGAPGYEGVVWIQRQFDLPADWSNQPLVIQLGIISDTDTTWLNGKEIGQTDSFETARRYTVPAGIAKSGRNVITLRITNAGGGGVDDKQMPMLIHPVGAENAAIPLSGPSRFQETARLAETGRPLAGNPNVPSVLYNGMIAPLLPCSLTGAIWYQGEANASRAYQYRSLLPALIRDWRQRFGTDDLAFHIVSLANYEAAADQPRDHEWAELREAQAMTAKTVPHCGLAVAIDIGEAGDIHPKNKREVGRRLALSALASTYAKSVSGSGPWFRSIDVEGDRIRIHFDHTAGGLLLKEPSARSFAIAGEDRKFVWANATLDGTSVVLSSPVVPKPVAVRHAWDSNPQASLYNGAGLPAVPFRSDDWPGMTGPR